MTELPRDLRYRQQIVQYCGRNACKYDNQILVGEVVNVAWRIHPGQNVTAEKHSECRHDYCDNYRHNSCISYIFFKSFFILGTKALGYWK